MSTPRRVTGTKRRLVEKSIEAYILALETINRLSVSYRIEAFAYLMCNAWELLLKARIADSDKNGSRAIYRKDNKPGYPRETITLDQALRKVFPKTDDHTRQNIEVVSQFRNDSAHYIISHVPKELLMIFQSSVLNYHTRIGEWFGISLSDRISVGMMTIVYDFAPEQFDMTHPTLRKKLGKETALYLAELQTRLRTQFHETGQSAEFSVDLSYSLVLSRKKNDKDGDIYLTSGANGVALGTIPVPTDPSKSHPFRMTELVDYLRQRFNDDIPCNTHDIVCVVKAHGIEKRAECFYQGTVTNHQGKTTMVSKQYSHFFADWILKMRGDDPGFFTKARARAKNLTAEKARVQ